MYEDHKEVKTYTLDKTAQKEYEVLMDGYSRVPRQKYELNNCTFS